MVKRSTWVALQPPKADTTVPQWLIDNGLSNFSLYDYFATHALGNPIRATSVPASANSAQKYTRQPAGGSVTLPYVTGSVNRRSYNTDDSGGGTTAAYTFTSVLNDVVGLYAECCWGPGTDGGTAALVSMVGPTHSTAPLLLASAHIIISNNQAKAQYIQDSVITTIATINYTAVAKDNATKFLVGWRVSGTSIFILDPTGVETEVPNAEEIINRMGRVVTLEHFWTTGQCRPRYFKYFVIKA
jgi:hypothetical protein